MEIIMKSDVDLALLDALCLEADWVKTVNAHWDYCVENDVFTFFHLFQDRKGLYYFYHEYEMGATVQLMEAHKLRNPTCIASVRVSDVGSNQVQQVIASVIAQAEKDFIESMIAQGNKSGMGYQHD